MKNLFDLTGRGGPGYRRKPGTGPGNGTTLAGAGAEVVLSGRHEEELRAAAEAIGRATGRRAEYVVADMNQRDDVARLAEQSVRCSGKIDILVNNAGTNVPQAIDRSPRRRFGPRAAS